MQLNLVAPLPQTFVGSHTHRDTERERETEKEWDIWNYQNRNISDLPKCKVFIVLE